MKILQPIAKSSIFIALLIFPAFCVNLAIAQDKKARRLHIIASHELCSKLLAESDEELLECLKLELKVFTERKTGSSYSKY